MINVIENSNGVVQLSPVYAELDQIRSEYIKNRFAFIDGFRMENILKGLGATDEDLQLLRESGKDLAPDPTLPFRESRNGRFLIDLFNKRLMRLKYQPFVLSDDEDFVRDDSGQLRAFRGIQDNVQLNTAFVALFKFKAYVIHNMDIVGRKKLEADPLKWVSTVFQLRTLTSPGLVGEPAKEGVHADGVEHTMTTFMKSTNMTSGSAISQIHNNDQITGTPWDQVDEKHIVGQHQHTRFLDTLLIVDTELKHSVSSVVAHDPKRDALRDMIIFFTRRPKTLDHSTFQYDSLTEHPDMPINEKLI